MSKSHSLKLSYFRNERGLALDSCVFEKKPFSLFTFTSLWAYIAIKRHTYILQEISLYVNLKVSLLKFDNNYKQKCANTLLKRCDFQNSTRVIYVLLFEHANILSTKVPFKHTIRFIIQSLFTQQFHSTIPLH